MDFNFATNDEIRRLYLRVFDVHLTDKECIALRSHQYETADGKPERYGCAYDPKFQRRLVEERDRGVCALCGVDTTARQREALDTLRLVQWLANRHADDLWKRGELQPYPGFTPSEKRYAAYRQADPKYSPFHEIYSWVTHWTHEEMKRRFGDYRGAGGHTWEMDHIVPVIEGGGECDLSNLRTLCLACHKQETAKLARRRAERRRTPAGHGIEQPELSLQ